MNLSFLKNVEVKEVATKSKASRVTLEKHPVEGADFRVYKNGRIFPAAATATEYNLAFGPKLEGEEDGAKAVTVGNGLDIFSSENWQMIATPQTMLFIGVVPRQGNAKIDIYGSTSYDKDSGEPTRDIYANSVSAFGKDTLIDLLTSVYGVDFSDEGVDYVDLSVARDFQIKAPHDVYSIPKVVSRGDKKGQPVFVTRMNISVFPLVVFEVASEPEDIQPTQEGTTSAERLATAEADAASAE